MNGSFLDANIFVYHLLQNDDDRSPRCTTLFEALDRDETHAHCSSTVVLETVFVLERKFRVPRSEAYQPLSDLISIPAIDFAPESRAPLLNALSFWRDNAPLSFADCFHLVLTHHLGLDRIYTLDQKMERYPGVTCVEP